MRSSDCRPKVRLVLKILFVAFLLIMARVWQLAVVQYDERVKEAERPAKRLVLTAPARGTIRDRFNLPLATNSLNYQAAIRYRDIARIPSSVWELDEEGKRVRVEKRKIFIRALAKEASELLGLDEERLVDEIYSKAVFYASHPYVIKNHLTEEEYYRVRALERKFPGLLAIKGGVRHYPEGRVGASVIGYMGAMSKEGLEQIFEEKQQIQERLSRYEAGEEILDSYEEELSRLEEIEDRCYTARDAVGKAGIEAKFDELLRGFYGKEYVQTDAKGFVLRPLPGGRPPAAGHRLLLTISEELQRFSEELLIRHEGLRMKRQEGPWIRGGAIVVLDPLSGEVLALASTPRFDPNDFISSQGEEEDQQKRGRLLRWLESESYIAALWDQQLPLAREEWHEGKVQDVEEMLTLNRYLSLILPNSSEVGSFIEKLGTLKQAVVFQRNLDEIREQLGVEDLAKVMGLLYPEKGKRVESKLSLEGLKDNASRLFAVDLLRLFVPHDYFSDELLEEVGALDIEQFRSDNGDVATLFHYMKALLKEEYHLHTFSTWRERYSKEYLQTKRAEERKQHTWARPYLDYLDTVERDLYTLFWQMHRLSLLHTFLTGETAGNEEIAPYEELLLTMKREIGEGAHRGCSWYSAYSALTKRLQKIKRDQQLAYLKTMRTFRDLTRPLVQAYPWCNKERPLEKDLAKAFYPRWGFGYMRSNAFSVRATHGSIFKLITAYAALSERYEKGLQPLNPFEIVDQVRKTEDGWKIGYYLDGKPIPRIYKGGRVPKSLSKNIGRIDLVKAIERSSNPYFALLAADHLEDPENLAKAAALFSYGSKTGIDLPGEISGLLPSRLSEDPGDLYASAIGQGTLVVTPLQTAVMLSTLANGGEVLKPQIVKMEVASKEEAGEEWLEEILERLKVRAPLFRERAGRLALLSPSKKEVVRHVPLKEPVAKMIKEGMSRVVEVTPPARFGATYGEWKEMIAAYTEMKPYIIGKSSSAESMERISLDPSKGVEKVTHSWFGGIIYEDKEKTKPELVVVVYLPFGERGNEALPPVALIGKKWREIKSLSNRD